jgi:predicted MFS family arabinose efflux permease
VLRALRSRDFRVFWLGSLVANLGVWVQQIALGWLVYDLTRQASWLGTVSFCGNMPMLVLGLVGGAIADRASRRTILLASLSAMAAAALTLAVLTAAGDITVGRVIAISMVAGTAAALFGPAMQAVIPSLVEPSELLHAVSLNSVQFNLARTLGPALAGVAYGVIGPAGCFALNAAGLVVMTVMIARIRLPRGPAGAPLPMLRALRDAVRYVRPHAVIAPALLLTAVMSVFGFPYIILLPALARDVLHLGTQGLGGLMAAVGAGAIAGGLGLSAVDPARKDQVAAVSALAFGAALVSFAVVRSPIATGILLFLLGVLQTVAVASINTTIQLTVHDGMRGRVMSMLTVILFGFATTGALFIGLLGDRIGVPRALAAGGAVIVVAAAVTLARVPAGPVLGEGEQLRQTG